MIDRPYRVDDMVALLRHAEMSSSYKPTLLAGIVRRVKIGDLRGDVIRLESLAEEYLERYWTQVVIFRLRHSARDSAAPVIIQTIQAASAASRVRKLVELPPMIRQETIKRIARVLTINVLSAFHKSKPNEMLPIYQWQAGQDGIQLMRGAQPFIAEHSTSLTLIANYFLARYLSRLNSAPHIVEKIERATPARASLRKFANLLNSLGEQNCFYCGIELSPGAGTAIDHFVPWAFVLEDQLWNLVRSCRDCNSQKSDGLPNENLLSRLIALNKRREMSPALPNASALTLAPPQSELTRLYRLARDEQWPLWNLTGGSNPASRRM